MASRRSMTKREPIAELEDIRDDCIGIALETKMSFKQIHENGGPTPQTQSKWLYRETRFPQLATIRAMLRACDYDLTVTRVGEFEPHRFSHAGIKYPKPAKKKAPRRNGSGR
jgi:hypothetical protein